MIEEVYRDLKSGAKSLATETSNFAEKNKDVIKDFGLFNVYLQEGVTLIICILLVFFGCIWYINRKIYKKTIGKIVESECTKNNLEYICNFRIKFTYDTDKVHIFSVSTNSSKKYQIDDNITIFYDINDPTTEPSIEQNYSSYFYLALIVFGSLGCIRSISSIYFAKNFDFVAQAQGVKSGIELGNYAFSPLFGSRNK
jgi:hypothetical protein